MSDRGSLDFAKDVLAAVVWAMLGGPAGWMVLLGIWSVEYGSLPKNSDFLLMLYTLPVGLAMGAVVALIVRAFVDKIRCQWLWGSGFFLLGMISGPVSLIALAAYAMSGRPY